MQDKNDRKSNLSRTAETTDSLIKTARELFAENGYAATSTPRIVKAAGVTRGALYHHFADKAGLFRAVIEREARAVAAQIDRETVESKSASQALKDGSQAYFNAIAQPGRAKLLLVEGPAVLGLDVMSEIDAQTGASELRDGLESAVESKEMDPAPTDALANILSAAFDRAALAVDAGAKADDYRQAIDVLLSGLLNTRN